MLLAEYDYKTDIAVQRAEALEIGMQKGMQQGMQKGMQKGKLERNTDIALKMVSDGLDIRTIAKYTDLPVSEIEKMTLS